MFKWILDIGYKALYRGDEFNRIGVQNTNIFEMYSKQKPIELGISSIQEFNPVAERFCKNNINNNYK